MDHSDQLTISYEDGVLTISFNSDEAFENARKTWDFDGDFVLISNLDGCGDDGDRCYFRVSSFSFKAGIIIAYGSAQHPDELINKGYTEWGWWTPRDGSGSGSNGGSSGGSNGNGGSNGGSGGGSGRASSFSRSLTPTATGNAGPSRAPSSAMPTGTSSDFGSQVGQLCVADPDNVNDLPAACFGERFDVDLDNNLGWTDLSQQYISFLDQVAPGRNHNQRRSNYGSNMGPLYKRGRNDPLGLLSKRCWPSFLCEAIDTYIVQPVSNAWQAIQQATTISGSINQDISWVIPDPDAANDIEDGDAKQVESPWGDSILLKSFQVGGDEEEEGGDKKKEVKRQDDDEDEDGLSGYLNIFCVGCGVSGSASIAGRASWTPLGGFTEGQVEMHVDVKFVLQLGIDAQLTYSQTFENELFNVGLPGLSYGVITIGPFITLGTKVELEAAAKGQILAGAEMGLQDAHVLIDFINPSNSDQSGWEPYFKPVFEASGSIELSASLGLPMGVRCGIQVASWDKSLGLIDEPSIKGTAQVAASIGLDDDGGLSAGFDDTDGCVGIATQLSWRNQLYVDVFGFDQIDLWDTGDMTLARGCIE